LTISKGIVARFGLREGAFDGAHGLIGESLEPEDPRKKAARSHTLVEDKAHHSWASDWRNVLTEHPFDPWTRASLVAQQVQDVADQAIAHRRIRWVGALGGDSAKPLRDRQSLL
jgi:hypothetical protein